MQFKCSYIKVGDLAQLVTCLPGEHEGPWSDAIPHVKAWHNGTCFFFHWSLLVRKSSRIGELRAQ